MSSDIVRKLFEQKVSPPYAVMWTGIRYVPRSPHDAVYEVGCYNRMYSTFAEGYSLAVNPCSLSTIAVKQWDWVERMGWHNKLPLEYLALIASEVGEAVNECRGDVPTEKLGEELADIILRVVDFAQDQKIDIEAKVLAKMEKNEQRGTRGRVK